MSVITYERITPKLIKVRSDGVFAGYLEKGYHKPDGFQKGFTYWGGKIIGRNISGATITAAKAKIAKIAQDGEDRSAKRRAAIMTAFDDQTCF